MNPDLCWRDIVQHSWSAGHCDGCGKWRRRRWTMLGSASQMCGHCNRDQLAFLKFDYKARLDAGLIEQP